MTPANFIALQNKFTVRVNKDWTLSASRSGESYTHNYHRYPAKFIPQVVKKLIENYTKEGDKIADVFAGCGTTLVESKIHGRQSVGVDINPVAQLITNAKINPVRPSLIQSEFEKIKMETTQYCASKIYFRSQHPRIDYWFTTEDKNKIAFLYHNILKIRNQKCMDFFLCALSNILKNCSRWLQDSTKPQVDPEKKIADPFTSFIFQVKKMIKRNEDFYNALKEKHLLKIACSIKLADARRTRIKSGSVSAIISSPPYVTSYEYADIHQLTGFWFEYISEMTSFRKQFIGTFYSNNTDSLKAESETAEDIVKKLKKRESKMANEVANYFNEMNDVAEEMNRILKDDGVACLVVGNTTLRGVKVKSAQAFAEILFSVGFEIEKVIRRKIAGKLIPPTRDKVTGKFTKPGSTNSKKVYPDEFIIIARKQHADN